MSAPKICSIPDCESTIGRNSARGWCYLHYQRWQRHGDPLHGGAFLPNQTTEERFWAKVDKTDTCWLWTASRRSDGYGQIRVHGNTIAAHRFAYELEVGQIPEGKYIDHTCHNRACVNPSHLRLATPKQNGENRRGSNRNSASGVRGVSWLASRGKWQAGIGHKGRSIFLGYFETIKAAESAVTAARNELFTHHQEWISHE